MPTPGNKCQYAPLDAEINCPADDNFFAECVGRGVSSRQIDTDAVSELGKLGFLTTLEVTARTEWVDGYAVHHPMVPTGRVVGCTALRNLHPEIFETEVE